MTISATAKNVVIFVGITLILYLAYQSIDLRSQNSLIIIPLADCLVVLGAAVWPGGFPSLELYFLSY